MKIIYTFLISIIFTLSTAAQTVNVTTGAGYANDVFYSFENGTVATVDRLNWDIAFNTNQMSVSILANNGSGVELYTYSKGDSSAWSSLDTTNMNWKPLYNSIETWDEGAFNYHSSGHPDYGWGIYNMANHNIYGDSLYVIKTAAGNFKKLFVEKKDATTNKYYFKYANLDGSAMQNITLDISNYTDKNFIYYSLDSMQTIDREPVSEDWDLLFTKYFDYNIPYTVTGVLTNSAYVKIEELSQSGLDQSTFTNYNEANFSMNISEIGSDWKAFNMTSFTYEISDSTVFFAKNYNSNGDSIYRKMYFTAFSGSSTGIYTFEQELLLHTDIQNINNESEISIYPNPTTGQIFITPNIKGETDLNIYDVNGRNVFTNKFYLNNKNQKIELNLSWLEKGVYFIRINNKALSSYSKIIID